MSFDPNNVPLEYLLQPELLNEREILSILEAVSQNKNKSVDLLLQTG